MKKKRSKKRRSRINPFTKDMVNTAGTVVKTTAILGIGKAINKYFE